MLLSSKKIIFVVFLISIFYSYTSYSERVYKDSKDKSVKKFYLSSSHDFGSKSKSDNKKLSLSSGKKTLVVKKGDTMIKMFSKAGFSKRDALGVGDAIRKIYPPKLLKIGQEIKLFFNKSSNSAKEVTLVLIDISDIKGIKVVRLKNNKFKASKFQKHLKVELKKVNLDIHRSLFKSLGKAGVVPKISYQLVKLLSYNVDFQRDIKDGDHLEMLYSSYSNHGKEVNSGKLIYASLGIKGKAIKVYRYVSVTGKVIYCNEKGENIQGRLLKTPVDGARITSSYGLRKHPVSGYSKIHKGIDFGAPKGTPIYAAGDGKVVVAKLFGTYGNYIKIKHNGDYSTAYAHMNNFAKNMKTGKVVRQGDIIGYVGKTGRVTGPHLHYEVVYKGKPVDPKTVDNVRFSVKQHSDLKLFKKYSKMINNYINNKSKVALHW